MQIYACAAPEDPAPREAQPSLLWVTPPSSVLIDQWGAAYGAEPGAARLGIPLLFSPPRPPRAGLPGFSRCVVITWAARGAQLVLVFLGLAGRSSGELLSFPGSTSACTSADLRAPSALTLESPAGRSPVMPLVRYRKVAILGYRSVGESLPSREHRCFVARRGALSRKWDTRTQCGLGRSRVCCQEMEGWRDAGRGELKG